MHAGQHGTHSAAVQRGRVELAGTGQLADNRRRLVVQCGDELPVVVGNRCRHRNVVASQMIHQVQVERELFECQVLKNGQHKLAGVGTDEKIAVFDTRRNALNGVGGAQRELSDPDIEISQRD